MWTTESGTFFNFYIDNSFVKENLFIGSLATHITIPTFEDVREQLPKPSWEGHDDVLACYWKTWEIAFRNLYNPTPENGFVSPYIDTAFNGNLFMWDSAFILMFARYAHRLVNFQQTLDNFYCKQHPDGYICREIREFDGGDCWQRFDPGGTGPNIMAWTEWEYYLNYGDKTRLARVFPPLMAYYEWFRDNRTWPDGTYWATGWSCGMDNQPRVTGRYHPNASHGYHVWADTCFQQIFTVRLLRLMAQELNRTDDVSACAEEAERLAVYMNIFAWDDESAFYYDLDSDRNHLPVKSIGAYWALVAGIVPPERLPRFIAHLEDEHEFNRPHRIPALSADDPNYREDGDYWNGGIWSPTNYMVLRGLRDNHHEALAHEIAMNHIQNVTAVFNQTGTVWENYAPEKLTPGNPAKSDFVGWTGLSSIATLIEYVLGLRPEVAKNRLLWDVRLLDAHGITQYPFGETGLLDLQCAKRNSINERPVITIQSNVSLIVELCWGQNQREIILIEPSENN